MTGRDRAEALLLDFDGVLRRFDPAHATAVAQRYDLPADLVPATAFEPSRLRAAVTGATTHDDWLAGIVDGLVAAGVDAERAGAAVADWSGYRGEVDEGVLAFVREVRAAGVPVALASNATDRLDADLAALGLSGEVDAVVNSSALGHAKPSAEFFTAGCRAVGVPTERCLLLDDSERHVRGARAAGLIALRYLGPTDLRYARAALRSSAA